MNKKTKIKITVDVMMTLVLLFLMGYQLWGDVLHEWAGLGMFALFLLHHGLNWKWHKHLLRGKYTPLRTVGTVVNALIFLLMLLLMASGIVMSRYVFDFLRISGGMSLARTAHLVAPYWLYVLTAFHLGLHGAVLLGMMKKATGIKTASKLRTLALRLLAAACACYGAYAFIKRDFLDYMFYRTHFAFFDFSEPAVFFLIDYLAVMALFAFGGYYLSKAMRRSN